MQVHLPIYQSIITLFCSLGIDLQLNQVCNNVCRGGGWDKQAQDFYPEKQNQQTFVTINYLLHYYALHHITQITQFNANRDLFLFPYQVLLPEPYKLQSVHNNNYITMTSGPLQTSLVLSNSHRSNVKDFRLVVGAIINVSM